MCSRFRLLLPLVLVALASPAVIGREGVQQGGVNKTLFVAVLDENGRPERQVTADDVFIREDGQDRAVVAVKPASQPISVAILVDTAQSSGKSDHYGTPEDYVRDMRVAVSAFAHQLLLLSPDAQVSLMEFGQAAVTMVKYTSDLTDFDKGVNRIVVRSGVGSVLGEALQAANTELAARPSTRRAIVSINLEPSDEQSFENSNPIRDSFRKSGAQLWSVSVQRGGLKNSKRDVVLNDFAKMSGGQRDFIVDISAMENILKAYASALAMQYEVTYQRPESAKNVRVIQVGTPPARKLKVHASGFAPQ
jgi:hypothetical protein